MPDVRGVEHDAAVRKPTRRMHCLQLPVARMSNSQNARHRRGMRVQQMYGRGHVGSPRLPYLS